MEDIPKEKRLIPSMIDYRAENDPNKIFAYLPGGNALQDGFHPLTYVQLAKAVDKLSWWLDKTLGKVVDEADYPAVPYIGSNDFRYWLLLVACMKTHRQIMIPMAINNTTESLVRLLNSVKCKTVLASQDRLHFWEEPGKHINDLRILEVPSVNCLLQNDSTERYPYTKTYNEGIDDPFWITHTSGTTGNATALHGSARYAEELYYDPSLSTNTPHAVPHLSRDHFLAVLLPQNWGAGLVMTGIYPLCMGAIAIILPPDMPQPVTPAYVNEANLHIPRGRRNGIIMTPDVLRETVRIPEYFENMKKYDWIGYAGAPLDRPTAVLISRFTRIQSLWGNTLVGPYHPVLIDPGDWEYVRFIPEVRGFFLEQFQDDLYEMCVRRRPHDARPCFLLNPDIDVYHTKDIFRLVPGREGFWTTAGRVDDFVKLTDMTKFNAVEMEQIIDRDSDVEKALVGGDGRSQSFAIVQVIDGLNTNGPVEATLERIWPAIEEANKGVSAEAKVRKDLVLLAAPDRPINRTLKGTADRRNTFVKYNKELADMYERAGFGRVAN